MQRFWDKVDTLGRCWEWEGTTNNDGYGSIKIDGKMIRAHRFSWSLAYGIIPNGLYICHHCDNPSCVKPSHLFMGTQKDNMQDSVAKGRIGDHRGDGGGNSKLCENDVYEIRRLHSLGVTKVMLGKMWRISESQAGRIVNRFCWKNI